MNQIEPTEVTGSLLHVFERASRDLDWWATDLATLVIDLTQIRPFVTALAGITMVLRDGEDPMWVIGGTAPAAAFTVTHEWLAAGIDAGEVGAWLRAGCWDPKSARRMIDVGLRPARLLDEAQQPAYWVSASSGDQVPVAQAVADSLLTPEQAVRAVVRP